ncbi:MAG: beta-N-acetylglucosaminidase domain-containing protein, partial [Pseudomonadota bacterium]
MTATAARHFRLGVVEGFFGRQWSWQARRDHALFLAQQQFTTYLYAPKNDVHLRKQWFEPYPADIFAELKSLAAYAGSLGVEFGVGLSPFELYRDFSAGNRDKLLRKLDQLNQLEAPLLAVLFDDMLGDLPGLAATQLAIFECIRTYSNAKHFMLCPTYYSDDPLLIKHFGKQPERYLDELGQALPKAVDIFWTGPKVISQDYPRDHLLEVGARLRRKPLLWDNYPVNDAKRLTQFLHLLPFEQRAEGNFSLQPIVELCSGLLANPMNQCALSKVPLANLSALFQQVTTATTNNMPFGNPAL